VPGSHRYRAGLPTQDRSLGTPSRGEKGRTIARRLADRRRWVVALILVGVLGVAACDAGNTPLSIPSTLRTPELVGIVEGLDPDTRPPLVRLVGGTTYDRAGATLIVERGTLAAGSLLLAGTAPTPWYGYLDEIVPGCYALITRGREDGTTVVTEVGLRLTKAPGFSAPDDPDGVYDRAPNDYFCLGPDGLVTGYGLNR
jgi:hypothetical protein